MNGMLTNRQKQILEEIQSIPDDWTIEISTARKAGFYPEVKKYKAVGLQLTSLIRLDLIASKPYPSLGWQVTEKGKGYTDS